MTDRYVVVLWGNDIVIGSAMTRDVALEIAKKLSLKDLFAGNTLHVKDRRTFPSFRAFAKMGKLDFGKLCKTCKGRIQVPCPPSKGATRLCHDCYGAGYTPATWTAGDPG